MNQFSRKEQRERNSESSDEAPDQAGVGFQEMSLEQQHDYENPIEAFQKELRPRLSILAANNL